MKGFLFSGLMLACLVIFGQSPFIIYNDANSPLPSNKVTKLVIDDNNSKWIGTETGLAKLNSDDTWEIFDESNSDIPGNQIASIFIDGDIVWVGTQLNGMAKFEAGVWTVYNPTNSPLPDFQVKSIQKDGNDTMWIGTPSGLVKWDGADYWFVYNTTNSLLHSNNINDIYIDAENHLYIGTLNGGLSTYIDGFIDYYRTDNSLISDNTVLNIDEDIYNNKWLATSFGGLSVFTADETFLKFTPLTSDISDWSIDAVHIDNENIGVIGMSSTGLELFDNTDWTRFSTENSDIPDDYINTVTTDDEGLIWFGTDTGGLVVLNRDLVEDINTTTTIEAIIYPNPACEVLMLQTGLLNSDIQIYNLAGVLISTQKIRSNTTLLNVSDLKNGNYILHLVNNNNVVNLPFVVMH